MANHGSQKKKDKHGIIEQDSIRMIADEIEIYEKGKTGPPHKIPHGLIFVEGECIDIWPCAKSPGSDSVTFEGGSKVLRANKRDIDKVTCRDPENRKFKNLF